MKIARLRFRDGWLLGRMAGLLIVLVVAQRRLSLPALVRRFDGFDGFDGGGRSAPVAPDRLVRLCRALLVRLYRRDFCMQQSLLVFYFLRKWGYRVRLHFGIAKKDGGVAGHAWLDLDGEPFHEARNPATTYAITYSYPRNHQEVSR